MDSAEGDVVANKSKHKVWVVLSVVFLVVVVVLGMVMFLLFHNNEGEFQDEDTGEIDAIAAVAIATNEAAHTCDGIKNGYFNGELTFNETKQKYKEASGDGDNFYKVKLAMCYAGFVGEVTGNTDWSIDIMEEVEPLVYGSDTVKMGYYAILGRLYAEVGDNEGAERVGKILSDFDGGTKDDDTVIQEEHE